VVRISGFITKLIIAGTPPAVNGRFTNYVHLWEHLERSGITDINGVWGFYNGTHRRIAQTRYAGP
jgi:hypothetical protein